MEAAVRHVRQPGAEKGRLRLRPDRRSPLPTPAGHSAAGRRGGRQTALAAAVGYRLQPADEPSRSLPTTPHPRDFYAVSKILLMPSLLEPAGLVAMEGMFNGIPVLAGKRGGLTGDRRRRGLPLRHSRPLHDRVVRGAHGRRSGALGRDDHSTVGRQCLLRRVEPSGTPARATLASRSSEAGLPRVLRERLRPARPAVGSVVNGPPIGQCAGGTGSGGAPAEGGWASRGRNEAGVGVGKPFQRSILARRSRCGITT